MDSHTAWLGLGAILTGLLLRVCTSLHPYSGENVAPMFGDYEAQRHWMEITYNLPVKDWYFNTTDNDLMYWGLDYPPLTAYHSWLCGMIAAWINLDFIALNSSRGYESHDHKLFMRYTVLIADLLTLIPALCLYFHHIYVEHRTIPIPKASIQKSTLKKPDKSSLEVKSDEPLRKRTTASSHGDSKQMLNSILKSEKVETKKTKNVTFSNSVKCGRENSKISMPTQAMIMALLYPGLILIDHGHFQYNCISLGLTIFAVTCIMNEKNFPAAILFTLAINYKQMQLYHAFPFFFYLLNYYLVQSKDNKMHRLWNVGKLGMVVIATFMFIWIPFLTDLKTPVQVLHRIFPIARGVFEDKVSNFWCALNVFIKLKTIFTNIQMARICLATTLLAVVPSSLDLLIRGTKTKFILALTNCSLAFFLFSFQVHEKSILIAAVSVLLYFHQDPFACFWFLYLSVFSMLPLLIKDRLHLTYLGLVLFYVTSYRLLTARRKSSKPTKSDTKFGQHQFIRELLITLLNVNDGDKDYTDLVTLSFRHLMLNRKLVHKFVIKSIFIVSILGTIILQLLITVVDAPHEYPDLFPLMISVYAFVHFAGFFVYFNYRQITAGTRTNVEKLKRS